ncbi:MAG: Unknown protein [uncultured Campylobacterales bacterium]|uniref:Uncharacterized protein n=1 Tax=uncultured Campylobacterales bacterium TaxID=352960 RepID=A0A6S6SSG7_9BACT|nr:MAG: Unknown protein [uncultured Campylobacterales bacterium]
MDEFFLFFGIIDIGILCIFLIYRYKTEFKITHWYFDLNVKQRSIIWAVSVVLFPLSFLWWIWLLTYLEYKRN